MGRTVKRELLIRRLADGHVAKRIDVTGQGERTVERVLAGALRNMDTDQWGVWDTDWGAPPIPAQQDQGTANA